MRNKSRLGFLALVLPLVLLTFTGAIADPATQPEKGDADTVTQTQSEAQAKSQNPTQKKKPASGGDDESPTDTFTPSETISADSAVSFPVDI